MYAICRGALLFLAACLFLTTLLIAQVTDLSTPSDVAGVSIQQTITGPLSGSDGNAKLVVRYEQGSLKLVAHRVSLRSVLQAIAQQTGLAVEADAGSGTGLVYVELGPGTVHDVLVKLLEGGESNYILLGSSASIGAVERLILSPRSPKTIIASQLGSQPAPQYGPGYPATPVSGGQPATEQDSEPESPPSANTALPPVQQNIDSSMQRYQQAAAALAASGKSRAEILDELQKQQIKELDDQAAQGQQH